MESTIVTEEEAIDILREIFNTQDQTSTAKSFNKQENNEKMVSKNRQAFSRSTRSN